MKVIQVLTTIAYGDGVGNDVLALDLVLRNNGYDTAIYAENIDTRIKNRKIYQVSKLPILQDEDILIYHLSTGTKLNEMLQNLSGKKMIIYHNITPAKWYMQYQPESALLCQKGIEEARKLATVADYCIADSEFNRQDLIDMGYQCEIDVLPILIPFDDYKKEPDRKIVNKYSNDNFTNIVFMGRIVPNKKQEDIIKAFYYYKKYYNEDARLFLVGSYREEDRYYLKLLEYVKRLGLEDVYFTGHIRFEEILAYYKIADVFLCMSEHEGFCIPLVEAMFFDLPIVAYKNTGISGTLGKSGIGIDEKNLLVVAGLIDCVVRDTQLREKILQTQRKQLESFDNKLVEKKFLDYLEKFIKQ